MLLSNIGIIYTEVIYVWDETRVNSVGKRSCKGRFPEEKVGVLLDFVQMRKRGGGRALPKFVVHFSQTVYIRSISGWGGRGRPLPKFFGTLAFKRSGTSCPNWREGGVLR